MFNGNTKHTSASHTEGDRFRFVLNINFPNMLIDVTKEEL